MDTLHRDLQDALRTAEIAALKADGQNVGSVLRLLASKMGVF